MTETIKILISGLEGRTENVSGEIPDSTFEKYESTDASSDLLHELKVLEIMSGSWGGHLTPDERINDLELINPVSPSVGPVKFYETIHLLRDTAVLENDLLINQELSFPLLQNEQIPSETELLKHGYAKISKLGNYFSFSILLLSSLSLIFSFTSSVHIMHPEFALILFIASAMFIYMFKIMDEE